MPESSLNSIEQIIGIYTLLNEVQPNAVILIALFQMTNRIALTHQDDGGRLSQSPDRDLQDGLLDPGEPPEPI